MLETVIQLIYLGSFTAHVFHSLDGGDTFSEVGNFCGATGKIDFVDSQHGWALTDEGIMLTTNGGKDWVEDFSLKDEDDYMTNLHMLDANNGWVVTNNGQLLKYTDSSLSCTDNMVTVTPNLNIHVPALDYQSLLGTHHNLWADFVFHGYDEHGNMLWRLSDFDENK